MKVSVVIASYNGAKFLSEQLQSIELQSRLPDEIIISDDCSTDETTSLIQNFIVNSELNIKLFENLQREGYTKNFSNGIEQASGDIIFLCDQDDFWFYNKIETIVELAQKNPFHNLFVNEIEFTDENLVPSGKTKLDQLHENGLELIHHGMGCATAIRKRFLELVVPIPIKIMGHDNWINTISDIVYDRYYHPEILQYYRRHSNVTSKINSNFISKKSSNIFSSIFKIIRYKKWLTGLNAKSTMNDYIFNLIEQKFDAFILIGDKVNINQFLAEQRFKKGILLSIKTKKFKFLHFFIFSIFWTIYYSRRRHSKFSIFSLFIENYFILRLGK